MVSEVDTYIMGEDKYSLLKAEDLITEVKKLQASVDAIANVLKNWTVVPSDGGLALKTAAISALAGKTTGSFDGLVNEKVRHG